MKKQALNFLWINLELPARKDPKDGYIYNPMPSEYIENMRKAAKLNPNADTSLWVDSKRLSPLQYSWIKATIAPTQLKDLRSIPEYNNEDLYSKGDTNPNWREGLKHSLIWRQVDAAKILIALQSSDYEQSFFVDMDFAHIELDSPDVQKRIEKFGFLIGGYRLKHKDITDKIIENQFFGITSKSKPLFKEIYKKSLDDAYAGYNGWKVFRNAFEEKRRCLPCDTSNMIYDILPKGSLSYQPSSKNVTGYDRTPSLEKKKEPTQIKFSF